MRLAGIALVFVGLFAYALVFSATLEYGLFVAMVASMPAFFVVFLGCSFTLRAGLKNTLLWFLLFALLTLLPWLAILPLVYQLISYAVLGGMFLSGVTWYRRRLKSKT